MKKPRTTRKLIKFENLGSQATYACVRVSVFIRCVQCTLICLCVKVRVYEGVRVRLCACIRALMCVFVRVSTTLTIYP